MREYREFTMKRIVVATDFSDASYGAVNYAKQLARYFSAKVLLVHVIDMMRSVQENGLPGMSPPERIDAAEEELQKVAEGLSFDGVRCAMTVRVGTIREVISNLIEERDADLLVIGTRGKGFKNGEGLGSVAEMLLRAVSCPVLTVARQVRQDACEATHPRSVLFPTEFSETSRAALAYTECLARHIGGRLLLLHVDENNFSAGQVSNHKNDFQKLVAKMMDPSVVSEYITRAGHAADLIVTVSKEKHVDFIVMGVHGMKQTDSARGYGTAFDVIRLARCPVFTLFAHDSKEADGSTFQSSLATHNC